MRTSIAMPFVTLVAAFAGADEPPVSPEVNPQNRTVTFRINAPQANQVTLAGDWMGGKSEPMTRDDRGVWSISAGPLNPGLAIYQFEVDGLRIPDPVNPRIKLRAETSGSLVDVPGNPPQLWQTRDVPHGEVALVRAKSDVTGDTRVYRVYTPPDYYQTDNSSTYPVLYLLHGNNGTEADWTDVGAAHLILDNLIADGLAAPMIVVMPWGHAVPFRGADKRQNLIVFERYLLEEIIPQVEDRYRVKQGPENRAIVGLSMGGAQALLIGLTHRDVFAHVGSMSSYIDRDLDNILKTAEDTDNVNSQLELLWIGCGRQDAIFEKATAFSESLTTRGVKHTFHATDGLHIFDLWRKHLVEVVPKLFR